MQLRDQLQPTTAVLLAVLVVCSGAASATALAGTTASAPATTDASADAAVSTTADEDDEMDPADEIYVTENGDAVLVYDESNDDSEDPSTATGHLGMDVSEGIMHVLVRDEVEDSNVTGDAQFVLTPDSLTGDGSFQAPRPDNLENLDVDVSAKRTTTDASARASFDMTYASESEYSTAAQIESASTNGDVEVSADEFSTSGSAQLEYSQNLGLTEHREYTLEEGTNQYRLQASEDYTIYEYYKDQWNTRENAKQTLQSQYASIAAALGGSADVTIQSYEFTNASNGQYRLAIEYEIVYSNIDAGLSQQVAQSIASAEDVEVSQETAQAVGDGIANMEVDRIHARYDANGRSMQAGWDVQLSNYDDLVRAGFDLAAESAEDENVTEQISKARKNYEAMQAANLVQTFTWDASLSSPSQTTVKVSGTMQYDTENYEAYVNELEARDLPVQGSVEFQASAQTEGDEVVADMQVSVDQKDLVDQSIDSLMQSAQSADTGSESTQRFLEAFQRSEFRKAKMDVSVTEDQVTFEAGANFENMESFQSVMKEEFGGELSSVYANIDGEDSKAYVRLKGAFSGDATKEDVREHEAVGEDTTIHMPGDWDGDVSQFPEMDKNEAREYLGMDPVDEETTENSTSDDGTDSTTGDDEGSGAGLPGFGMSAAFAAVAAVAALLLGRVRRYEP